MKKHKPARHKPTKCPNCKKVVDSASADEEVAPEDGDIGVCFYCGQINEFKITGDRVSLVKFPQLGIDKLKEEEPETYRQMIDYQRAIRVKNFENSKKYS